MFSRSSSLSILSRIFQIAGGGILGVVFFLFPQEAQAKSLCACLQQKTCLPPPQAIILCRIGANTVYFTREGLMTKESRAEELLAKLRKGNAAERTNAATDLGVLGFSDAKVRRALVSALQQDESKWVRRAAAKSIAKLRIPEAVTALRAAVNDRDQWVSHSASEGLRRFGEGEMLASNDSF